MPLGKIRQNYQDVKRLRKIVNTLIKHGFGFFITSLNLQQHLPLRKRIFKQEIYERSLPVRVRLVLEELGPTFIKFGQILSTRPDLIPDDYIEEFKKLQDDVPAFTCQEAEEQILSGLGKPKDELFQFLSKQPFAAASIAQVHSAVLKTGETVAVKIQRPGIGETIKADLNILFYFAGLIEKHIHEAKLFEPVNIVNEFKKSIKKELDFILEARNVDKFARNFASDDTVYIPRIYWEFTCKKILTMEKVDGININDLDSIDKEGLDRKIIALNGVNAVLKQIFIHGWFHADPHPGNLYVLKNNVICFLDFGMVGYIDEIRKEELSELLLAVILKDPGRVINLFLNIGIVDEQIAVRDLRRDIEDLIEKYYGLTLQELEIGEMMQEMIKIVHQYQVRIPSDFTLLGKALVIIEGVARKLDPQFNMVPHVEPFVQELLRKRVSPSRLFREFNRIIAEMVSLIKIFPGEAKQILRKIRAGKLKIELEHQGLENLISTMDKVSNRIAFSIIIAALIVGSSLIIKTHKGLSVLGIAGFIFAAILGIRLVISILHSRKL